MDPVHRMCNIPGGPIVDAADRVAGVGLFLQTDGPAQGFRQVGHDSRPFRVPFQVQADSNTPLGFPRKYMIAPAQRKRHIICATGAKTTDIYYHVTDEILGLGGEFCRLSVLTRQSPRLIIVVIVPN
jgi:hypothetical protein